MAYHYCFDSIACRHISLLRLAFKEIKTLHMQGKLNMENLTKVAQKVGKRAGGYFRHGQDIVREHPSASRARRPAARRSPGKKAA
jgi:hypothetical protein